MAQILVVCGPAPSGKTSLSIACAKACANALGLDLYEYIGGKKATVLPVPMMNVLNGGVHAGNNVEIQEFMLVPTGAESFAAAVRICSEIYSVLKKILKLYENDIFCGGSCVKTNCWV